MARRIPQVVMPKQDPLARRKNFCEVELGYSEEQARAEAERCLDCVTPYCKVDGCPLSNHIPEWLMAVSRGDYFEAAELSRETSNFAEVCGKVCPAPCMDACTLEHGGRSVNIPKIEAFIWRYVDGHGGLPPRLRRPLTGRKVAIVGAGPSGQTVAEEAAVAGHEVVLYDRWPKPGGLLVYGIPGFKLEKHTADKRHEQLWDLGVTFVGDTMVGKDVTVDELFAQGFDAVYLAMGAPNDSIPRITGVTIEGVRTATDYLVEHNLENADKPERLHIPEDVAGKNVFVLGGGDTAMDCVRTSARKGANVTCVYRRDRGNMPGNPKEVAMAIEEGAKFHFLATPIEFLDTDGDGRVDAVRCRRMQLGKPDASGRRRPQEIEGSDFDIAVDLAILAMGYNNDKLIGETTPELQIDKWGCIVVDPESGATTREGVFAGGDAVTGMDLVVTAVADARKGCWGMLRYLDGLGPVPGSPAWKLSQATDRTPSAAPAAR